MKGQVEIMKITHYEQASWGTHNKMKQEELQTMAKKIVNSCKFTSEVHHGYGTNDPEQCKKGEDFASILNGSMALTYESEVFPVKYVIHFDCGMVTEIIEMLDC